MKEMLAQRASQFRAIQRRLLTRFKDKTPAPLQNLDTLMEGTYRQLLHLADSIEENSISMETSSNALCCGTNLFNYIIKLWTNMSDEEFAVLESSVTPQVADTQDQVISFLFKLPLKTKLSSTHLHSILLAQTMHHCCEVKVTRASN